MAKTEGVQFTCDRCGRDEFVPLTMVDRAEWRGVVRQSDNGEVIRLYCAECYADYRRLLLKQDKEFSEFDTAKRKELK